RHPVSTLFPYTTLFRSCSVLERWVVSATDFAHFSRYASCVSVSEPMEMSERLSVALGTSAPPTDVSFEVFSRQLLDAMHELRAGDRKSTRLNSSHDQIS